MSKNELLWVEAPCWELSKHSDYTKFFTAVSTLEFGGDAKVVLETTSPSEKVEETLNPYLVDTSKPGGIFKFLSSKICHYSLPFEASSLKILAELIDTHAAPEVCNQLLVVRGDEVLLSWYDFPDDPFRIVGSVSDESVQSLAAELGSKVERDN
jgi:hypothetical protein